MNLDMSQIPAWALALLLLAAIALVGTLGAVVIYFLKSIHSDMRALNQAFFEFSASVPRDYASRAEVAELRKDCADDHRRLHQRLDGISWNGEKTSGD